MKKTNVYKLSAIALAIGLTSILLTGCGGGGGSSGTPPTQSGNPAPTPAPTPTPATPTGLTTPQYATGSAELAMLNQMNAYRQQCGFPAVQENTLLDQATVSHVSYMQQNGVITDEEVAGKPGFTGVTYLDRAVALSWPSANYVTGGSLGFYPPINEKPEKYGTDSINIFAGGVYHQQIIAYPVSLVGFSDVESSYDSNYKKITGSVSLGSLSSIPTGAEPLSFPCQGTTGVLYNNNGESPVPPATSGPWGTPITIMGNPSDAITLSSGTMTDPNNTVIPLHLLDSGTDPNNILAPFTAVAYPISPLAANTTYAVNITGTMNGAAFTKKFTFTTGN